MELRKLFVQVGVGVALYRTVCFVSYVLFACVSIIDWFTEMITAIFLTLITIVFVLIVRWYIIYFKYELHLKTFSGPTPLPIIGNIHQIGVKTDLIPSVTKLFQQHGDPLKLMFGSVPRLILADAKSVEFVLSSNTILKKSDDYRFFHLWLGMGLLTSFGTRWKQHRKLLTPAFHFKILERFVEVFNNQTNILIKQLEKVNKKEAIDPFPYITLYALDVICEATMNTSINAQSNSNSKYVRSVKEVCRIITERVVSVKMWDFCYTFSKDYQKEKKVVGVLHALSNSVIKNRSQEIQEQKIHNFAEVSETGLKKRVAFLDLLLTSTVNGNPLSHEAVREEVDTFMFEGHDTTTSGICFTLYCLSKHKEIQDKVFEEIHDILSDNENIEPSYEHLQKMKYLEQVIKEVLRMYPPVPFFSRVVTEDVTFEEKTFPKGVVLFVSAYNLHHNPAVFPNPEVFDPERFNTENSKNISHYSFVPFSAGSRNCIGQRFAMLEIKSVVCKILQTFKLLPVLEHQPVLVANAILTSENGLPIRFEKRKQ